MRMSPAGENKGVLPQPTPHSAQTALLLPWKLLWSIILPNQPGRPGHHGPQPSSGSIPRHLG